MASVMTPAELKAEGQMRSLFAVSDTTRQDFERILTLAPIEFSSNDIREWMDWADIPEGARGGLFNAAIKAGLIVRKMTVDGYPARIPSTGTSAHCAFVQLYVKVAA
jgi:hypothetical protein